MSRIIIIAALLLASLSPALAQAPRQTATERQSFPGTVADVQGSPVQLVEPTFTLARAKETPDAPQIDHGAVTVTNTCGRDIKRLFLIFNFKPDTNYGGVQNRSAVDQLRAGETRVVQSETTIHGLDEVPGWSLTVTATGAEFADGTRWAAARDNRRPLLMQYLSQPDPYLQVMAFQWTDKGYQASLQVDNTQVVAYRLGIVKDTAESFEVRIGQWVALNTEQPNKRAKLIDELSSLSAEQIFPREAYTLYSSHGQKVVEFGGVSIFIAELKFADGRTWQQDLTREALLWCN